MPSFTPPHRAELETLAEQLRHRLAVIGDGALREADPEAHLNALKEASEALFDSHARLKGRIHPRLEHFLANCSYEKALALIETELSS